MDNDMLRMQQDAMKRVRDMQKKARLTLEESKIEKQEDLPDETKENKSAGKKKMPFDFLKFFNFKEMDIDNDRAIILLIIFILSGEDTDEVLILALIYLLL